MEHRAGGIDRCCPDGGLYFAALYQRAWRISLAPTLTSVMNYSIFRKATPNGQLSAADVAIVRLDESAAGGGRSSFNQLSDGPLTCGGSSIALSMPLSGAAISRTFICPAADAARPRMQAREKCRLTRKLLKIGLPGRMLAAQSDLDEPRANMNLARHKTRICRSARTIRRSIAGNAWAFGPI